MKIKLDNKYAIITDDHNFTLCHIKVKGSESANAGEEYFTPIGYYGKFKGALKGYLEYSLRRDSETIETIEELIKRLDEIETNIMNLDIDVKKDDIKQEDNIDGESETKI